MVTNSLDKLIALVYPTINSINPKETNFLRQAAMSRVLDSIDLEQDKWIIRNEGGEEIERFDSKYEAIEYEIKRLREMQQNKIEVIGKKIKVNGEVLPLSEYEYLLENIEEYEEDKGNFV